MDISGQNHKGKKVEYLESDSSSDIQILLIPGVLNTDVWKHQIRYFSRKYDLSTFKSGGNTFQDDYRTIESILDQKEMKNTVLMSSNLGNAVVQKAESHENVVGSILSNTLNQRPTEFPEAIYNLFWKTSFSHPKIIKKLFFSPNTNYTTAKSFFNDIECPEYQRFISYVRNYSLKKPAQDSLVINSSHDRFSSDKVAKDLKPEVRISRIQNAGTFSYYEKPEEFNKAVDDFLRKIEDFIESKKLRKTREKNRTLGEFSDSGNKNVQQKGNSDREQPVLRKR
jgi:hypothetical protein